MVKLKTLNEIFKSWNDKEEYKEASYSCGCGSCGEGCFGSCDVVRIRQEAIKWAKTIRSDKWNTIYYSNPLFIDFFNITKEDLKC